MIDIKKLESQQSYFEQYKKTLINRGVDQNLLMNVLSLNKTRKELIRRSEEARAKQKRESSEIGRLKKEGKDTSLLLNELETMSKQIKEMESQSNDAESTLLQALLNIPNICHESVPIGNSAENNFEVRRWGTPFNFSFPVKDHIELGESLGILDFTRASKTTGARFVFLKKEGALLERALIQFMLDLHIKEHGYEELFSPYFVNSQSLIGTGNFPKFRGDLFHIEGTDYYLIPTAEVPVTNFYSNEILKEIDLPIKFVSYTPCFRSEAGSYGQDTKGLIRQHQFNKVELVQISKRDESYECHEDLTKHAEEILKRLELPFRTVSLCTGDISFGAAKCYDLEVWLPAQNKYREISSCSNFEDFQSRRAQIRYRTQDGGLEYVHTLNGSGLAVGRTWVAILENYQQEDGMVKIPDALQPYMGGKRYIGGK